jgi:hypothetical protein
VKDSQDCATEVFFARIKNSPQTRYNDYGLREKVRGDIGQRKDRNDTFSDTAARYSRVPRMSSTFGRSNCSTAITTTTSSHA